MPKQVDHAARRTEIAQAALRLCARDGLSGVSVGRVAQEADISKGLVQHYFASKIDLLRASARVLHEEIERHVRTAAQGAHSPIDVLRRVLLAMVELSVTAPVLPLAGHAFLAQSAADPDVRELYREGGDAAHRALVSLVVAAQPNRSAGIDPDAEARALLGLAGSLADVVLVGGLSPADAASILDYHLGRICSPATSSPEPDEVSTDRNGS